MDDADQPVASPSSRPPPAASESVAAEPMADCPQTVLSGQQNFFARLEEAISKDFTAAASKSLQMALTARACGFGLGSGEGFGASIEDPSCCFALLSLPLSVPSEEAAVVRADEPVWLEFSPQIAFAIVDRLLGGSTREDRIPDRPLTVIERQLLGRLAELAAGCIGNCWPPPHVRFRCVREAACTIGPSPDFQGRDTHATTAGAPSAAGADDAVWIVKFTLALARHAGAVRLCLPQALLPAAARQPPPAPAGVWKSKGAARPAASLLELSVATADMPIAPEELLQLADGDILVTDADANDEVIVRVAGIPKFFARLVTSNGRRAIQITRRIDGARPKTEG